LSILSKLQRLAKLSPCDWVILIQLVLDVALLEILLRLISLSRLVYVLSWGSHTRLGAIFPLFHRRVERQQLFDLSVFAARIVRGPECCLPRSLLQFWLLSVRRESVTFCIGVRKEAGTLHSHAWIETHDGLAVDGHQGRETFQPLLRFSRAEI
jgi:Transglutaminase-like superfamily